MPTLKYKENGTWKELSSNSGGVISGDVINNSDFFRNKTYSYYSTNVGSGQGSIGYLGAFNSSVMNVGYSPKGFVHMLCSTSYVNSSTIYPCLTIIFKNKDGVTSNNLNITGDNVPSSSNYIFSSSGTNTNGVYETYFTHSDINADGSWDYVFHIFHTKSGGTSDPGFWFCSVHITQDGVVTYNSQCVFDTKTLSASNSSNLIIDSCSSFVPNSSIYLGLYRASIATTSAPVVDTSSYACTVKITPEGVYQKKVLSDIYNYYKSLSSNRYYDTGYNAYYGSMSFGASDLSSTIVYWKNSNERIDSSNRTSSSNGRTYWRIDANTLEISDLGKDFTNFTVVPYKAHYYPAGQAGNNGFIDSDLNLIEQYYDKTIFDYATKNTGINLKQYSFFNCSPYMLTNSYFYFKNYDKTAIAIGTDDYTCKIIFIDKENLNVSYIIVPTQQSRSTAFAGTKDISNLGTSVSSRPFQSFLSTGAIFKDSVCFLAGQDPNIQLYTIN